MSDPDLSLTAIAAVGSNGVIGDGAGLPWHLPEDFARFKRVTMGGVLIMGRRTYESLGGALKGRTSVVLTRDASWIPGNTSGCEVLAVTAVAQIGRLLAERRAQQWWSAGGGEIYRVLWPFTTHLDLTEVKAAPEGKVSFPPVDPGEWMQTSRQPGEQFDFVTYERTSDQAADALRALVLDEA
ncbi:MAG: dihydrofolate reductase [Propionibacteriaceae bacterium]|nr:dihydrofolate reductase [Propionibacteriaceae bacterium]